MFRPKGPDFTNSPVVIIAIGPSKVPFPIHKGKLEQLTTFFDIHGGPANTPSPLDAGSPSAVGSDGVVVLRSEDADTEVKAEWDGGESNSAGEIKKPADFAIVDRFHTVGAFRIFTFWLYNEPPKTPTDRPSCRNLLQAYVLARVYKAYALQNLIIDRFRAFHTQYDVNLDNLIWLANRIGDNIACPLTAYFVEQIAFEIADGGFAKFEGSNAFARMFLKEGDWEVRVELFKALTKHAHASGGKLGDPAQSLTDDWHVEEEGENAGNLKKGARRGISTRNR